MFVRFFHETGIDCSFVGVVGRSIVNQAAAKPEECGHHAMSLPERACEWKSVAQQVDDPTRHANANPNAERRRNAERE